MLIAVPLPIELPSRPLPLSVVVVDDEPPARQRLIAMIDRLGTARVVAEAGNAIEAAAEIARTDPDVVVLDIRMPGPSGLVFASQLGARPIVVFTTAFAEHAVDAFDVGAADYLLKPVARDKLARALDRAASRLAEAPREHEPRIVSRAHGELAMFPATAIARFHAASKYTAFEIDGDEHLIEEPLDVLEGRLAPWGFLRVHRAELVQVAKIRTLRRRGFTADLELVDGVRVRVSRRLLPELRRRMRRSSGG